MGCMDKQAEEREEEEAAYKKQVEPGRQSAIPRTLPYYCLVDRGARQGWGRSMPKIATFQ